MQHKGTIKLMFEDAPVRSSYYYSVQKRKDIIIKWALEYGERFKFCALQIEPFSDIGKVKEDGNNFGKWEKK